MIIDAILKINSNAKCSVSGSDIGTCEITWHDGTTPIASADILTKQKELQTAYNNNKYHQAKPSQACL